LKSDETEVSDGEAGRIIIRIDIAQHRGKLGIAL